MTRCGYSSKLFGSATGKTDEEIEFLVGGLKWADGAPVDPTMWEGWLAAVQIACVGRTHEVAKS
jgi:hypothetical protein